MNLLPTPRIESAQRVVQADPQAIFDLLADPAMHSAIDGSGTVRQAAPGNPARLSKGARFGMNMRTKAPYKVTNTVVEFDEPRRIAWRHVAGHRWRYLLDPVAGGTLVREEWDPTYVRWAYPLLSALGFPRRVCTDMPQTLERLAEHFAGES